MALLGRHSTSRLRGSGVAAGLAAADQVCGDPPGQRVAGTHRENSPPSRGLRRDQAALSWPESPTRSRTDRRQCSCARLGAKNRAAVMRRGRAECHGLRRKLGDAGPARDGTPPQGLRSGAAASPCDESLIDPTPLPQSRDRRCGARRLQGLVGQLSYQSSTKQCPQGPDLEHPDGTSCCG